MKLIVVYILTLFHWQICFSQPADTIRIYDYLKPGDRWKLKIKNDNSFILYTNYLFTNDDITSTGYCKISDTTIQFICDTTKLKNKNLSRNILKQFSNIPFILCGDMFPKQKNFFIPRNINYQREDSMVMPKGFLAKYYRGDGYGSNIIELKGDKTYIIYDHSCMARFKEEGTWSLKENVVSFIPYDREWSMLEWFTRGRKLYITEDYLIGKKATKSYSKTKKIIVTETYFFLAKQPEDLSE